MDNGVSLGLGLQGPHSHDYTASPARLYCNLYLHRGYDAIKTKRTHGLKQLLE